MVAGSKVLLLFAEIFSESPQQDKDNVFAMFLIAKDTQKQYISPPFQAESSAQIVCDTMQRKFYLHLFQTPAVEFSQPLPISQNRKDRLHHPFSLMAVGSGFRVIENLAHGLLQWFVLIAYDCAAVLAACALLSIRTFCLGRLH